MKFGRLYKLIVEGREKTHVIEAAPSAGPGGGDFRALTLDFNVVRNTLASANTGRFTVYNLSPETRRDLYHDQFDTLLYSRISLQAGYQNGTPLPSIFQGNVKKASSYRQGTEWVTEIEAYDGGFDIINAQVGVTLPSGWSADQAIRSVLGTMQKVKVGAVGIFGADNARGLTLAGNSWDIANSLAAGLNASVFVDNELANFIGKNAYIEGLEDVPNITASSAILGTPRRYEARLDVEILFEPGLRIGQLVNLESFESIYNGKYIVIGVTHTGRISGAVGGDAKTIVSLMAGTAALTPVARAA